MTSKGLNANLAEIVRIDRELQQLVSSTVIQFNIGTKFKALKQERHGHVRLIHNYKPTGAAY